MSGKNRVFPPKVVYVIAELANAAQGKVELNFRLIEEAHKAGADAVKLQLYKYDELTTPSYSKYEIYKRTFYSFEERAQFIDRASKLGMDVWVDVFDRWGLDVAHKKKNKIYAIKIPPTTILDQKLVKSILEMHLPVAIGVGGYEDKDIDFALSALSGFNNPTLLIYGFQAFPTPLEHTSLARIQYLKDKYGYPVGFADHVNADSELALRMPEYAFFAGASVIEKHIILERGSRGLDHYSALEPHEFKKMVDNLRQCVRIYGSKHVTKVQKDYLVHATRITTIRAVKQGQLLFSNDIKFRRTENAEALFPNEEGSFFPAVALHDLHTDAAVTAQDIRKAVAGVVVVCRMHSKRMPNKALLKLGSATAIEHCLVNTLASKISALTVLATSTHTDDDKLRHYTLGGKVKFFKGKENDVAARILDAAKLYDLDFVVRVTGDSPLISHELIDFLLQSHFQTGADFSYFEDAPLGVRPEVISTQALEKLKSTIDTSKHSEYLSLYFKNNPDFFHINKANAPKEWQFSQYRLNLDYPEDYEVLKSIFEKLKIGTSPVSLSSVLEFLREHPEVSAINAHIKPRYQNGEFAEFINKVTKIKKQ